MLDAFLETRLDPPTVRPNWVSRDDLVRCLEQGTNDCVLTLLAAPAGYGKSTLLAQWLAGSTSRRPAWVALEPADNDPVRLWLHIVAALERAGCRVPDDPARLVGQSGQDIVGGLLPTLISALRQLPQRAALVLDDYHFVRTPACHEQIDFLVEHCPRSVALVILSRSDPPLRLGRLRAAGQLAEIRADQLRFDLDAASALLASERVQLSDRAVTELLQRTEGWPAGLYLATLSLSGREDPDTFVHEFSGDDRYIGDYLTEEVLSRQPPRLREFIASMSILDRFSAPLCDHVLQTSGSARILQDLERSNLFLVPLDARRHWFRFHHLFAAVARGDLEGDGARARLLHDRAADWFADHGQLDEAVRHAIAASSPVKAARLIQANWFSYVDVGRGAALNGWRQVLQSAEDSSEPAALITAAWIAVMTGDEAGLGRLLKALVDVPDVGVLPDGTTSVRSATALLRAMTGYEGPAELMAASKIAVELENDPRSPRYAFANFALGHACYVVGDLDGALAVLPKVAERAGSPTLARQLALGVMSLAAREQGDLELARKTALEAMAVVEAASLEAIPQVSIAFTALGASEAEVGNLVAGLAIHEKGLLLRRKVPGLSPWPTIHHLLAMGRALTAVGDLSRAERTFDEAGQLTARFGDGMDAMRSRLADGRAALRRRRTPQMELEALTPRELEVLRLLQGPLSLSAIAVDLFVSPNTVKTHAKAVYRKLGASTRSEAVLMGRRRALI